MAHELKMQTETAANTLRDCISFHSNPLHHLTEPYFRKNRIHDVYAAAHVEAMLTKLGNFAMTNHAWTHEALAEAVKDNDALTYILEADQSRLSDIFVSIYEACTTYIESLDEINCKMNQQEKYSQMIIAFKSNFKTEKSRAIQGGSTNQRRCVLLKRAYNVANTD